MQPLRADGTAMILLRLLKLQREILARIERLADPARQSWYSPSEFARMIGRKPATVRGWCRTGRLSARKRRVGRGDKLDWEIAVEELTRYREHGLLPKGAKRDQPSMGRSPINTFEEVAGQEASVSIA